MGLDMYLYARRYWPAASREALKLAETAGTTIDSLTERLENPDREDALYLAYWDFGRDSTDIEVQARWRQANAMLGLAGLLDMATPDGGGSYIGVEGTRLYVEVTCLYWRKANQIHRWFVENCQGGADECQEALVHPEQLAQLHGLCRQVLSNEVLAEDVLPTQRGFFFGGTEIDEYYHDQLQHTMKELERVVDVAIEVGGVYFYYQSSW